MKHWTVALTLLVCATLARAQERVPDEEAKKIGAMLKETAAKNVKLPLKSDVDSEKAFAMRKDDYGALVMPEKNLTADVLSKAGKDLVPVGQLWMKHLAPVVDGKVLPADKLVTVTVTAEGQEHKVFLCQIAVRKTEKMPELVLLGKDDKPLTVVKLEDLAEKQDLPIQFDATREGDDQAVV